MREQPTHVKELEDKLKQAEKKAVDTERGSPKHTTPGTQETDQLDLST